MQGYKALPDDFSQRIREQFPDEHEAFTEALDKPPRTSIRLNPHKWSQIRNRPDPPGDPVPWSLNGRFLKERPSFTHDPLFHAGCYYVQEASSMFLERVLAGPGSVLQTRTPKTILDACAAPGGKTTLLASLFPDALIVANEVIRSRVPPLLENSIKWGTGNIVVTQNDPSRFTRLPGFFDVILTDAPCSGEGLFRKNPAARLEWSPENTRHCSLRQRSILAGLWPSLRPDGLLIYTTCTYNPEENERNVAWLLEQTGGECVRVDAASGKAPFSNPYSDVKTGPDPYHDAPGKNNPIQELTNGGVIGYGFYPHRSAGEGFFLSVIRKPDSMTHASDNFSESSSESGLFQDIHDADLSGPDYYAENHPKQMQQDSHSRRGFRKKPPKTSGRTHSGKPAGGPELMPPDAVIQDQVAGWFKGEAITSETMTAETKTDDALTDDRFPGESAGGATFAWYCLGERLFRIRAHHFPLLQHLSRTLSVRYAGTEAGRIVRNEVIPVAAAAFDIHLNPSSFPVITLSRDDALRFLRRENLTVPPQAHAGWHLVTYEEVPLGWTKNVGRRMNNYYPAEWRIRK